MATVLSQKIKAGEVTETLNSVNNCVNQTISLVTAARLLYSASAEDREIVFCFLDFQDIREEPRKHTESRGGFACINTGRPINISKSS